MWQLLEADLEVLVHRGHLYLPLLLDPDIDREAQALPPTELEKHPDPPSLPGVLTYRGNLYAAAVSLPSLADNYPHLHPKAYEHRRRTFLEQYSLTADLWGVSPDPQLITILLHILPHFLRRGGLIPRRPLEEGEILDLIRAQLPLPPSYHREARQFLDTTPLREALRRLESVPPAPAPPPEGLVPTPRLREWCQAAVTAGFLARERLRLLAALKDRERWAGAQEGRLAALLYLRDQGSLEVDGFGFSRVGKGREYRVYKRTGPYALQDFYGRPYLFPDCRVAVTTLGRLRPVVVEHYKHPFLRHHGPGQEICLGSESRPLNFSAPNAIQVLEAGLNALFYSYDHRRRNGYHSLDEPPGKLRQVHFDDYRLPPDHPLILSGQVEVKNRAT